MMEQHYTGLADGHVRYTSVASGFERELALDPEGFVLDYPGLFRRDWPAGA